METRWQEIRAYEEICFRQYANRFGVSPEKMAGRTLATLLQRAKEARATAPEFLGTIQFSFERIQATTDIVKEFLRLQQDIADAARKGLAKDVYRHVTCYSQAYELDWPRLRADAQKFGVNTEASDWLLQYLQTIPFVSPFSFDLNAFVQFFPNDVPRIIVSAWVSDVIEQFVSRLLLNVLSKDGEFIPLNQRQITPEIINSAASLLKEIAEVFLGERRSLSNDKYGFLAATRVSLIIGLMITMGASDFVMFHEYAHILFGHHTTSRPLVAELEADNFALNCLLSREHEKNSDNLTTMFAAVGPILMLHFAHLMQALSGRELSTTHPPSPFRLMSVNYVILATIKNESPSRRDYSHLCELSTLLFDTALAMRGHPPSLKLGPHETMQIPDFNLRVIPFDGALPFGVRFSRSASTGV